MIGRRRGADAACRTPAADAGVPTPRCRRRGGDAGVPTPPLTPGALLRYGHTAMKRAFFFFYDSPA
jgi:hypothetical protein